jgi:hypothetical protein
MPGVTGSPPPSPRLATDSAPASFRSLRRLQSETPRWSGARDLETKMTTTQPNPSTDHPRHQAVPCCAPSSATGKASRAADAVVPCCAPPARTACCDAAEQAACCDPADKAACCGGPDPATCGCR